MRGLWRWVKKEFIDLTPVFLFFFFSFTLLKLMESASLHKFGLRIHDLYKLLIGTLLISKVFLVLDHARFMNIFNNRPLIYNILWKTWFYFIGTFILRYLELLISHSPNEAFNLMKDPRFLMIQVWVLVLVFVFCSTREFIKKMGPDKFKQIFFG